MRRCHCLAAMRRLDYSVHPDFWGHKPGSGIARNFDNSLQIIKDPETCDRGLYTEFYGYMLIPKSQRVAA
jgi:hypothetical protein